MSDGARVAVVYREGGELGACVEPRNALPVYEQLRRQFLCYAAAGRLKAGTRVEGGEAVARALGANLNTVYRAYRRLEADGVLESSRGKMGFVVAPGARSRGRSAIERIVRARVAEAAREAVLAGLSLTWLSGAAREAGTFPVYQRGPRGAEW